MVPAWSLVGSPATAPPATPPPTRRSLRREREAAAAAQSAFGDLPLHRPVPTAPDPTAEHVAPAPAPEPTAHRDRAGVDVPLPRAAAAPATELAGVRDLVAPSATPSEQSPSEQPPLLHLPDQQPPSEGLAPAAARRPEPESELLPVGPPQDRARGRRRAPNRPARGRRPVGAVPVAPSVPVPLAPSAPGPGTPPAQQLRARSTAPADARGAAQHRTRRRAGARRPALLGPAPGAAGRVAASLLVAGCALVGVGLAPVTADSVPAPTTAPAAATGVLGGSDVLSSTAASGVDVRPGGSATAATAPAPVAAPISVEIPSLGVSSDLVDLGTTADGSLEVPQDAAVAGWFTGSARPGATGPAVIAGHVDSAAGPGVFLRLEDLVPGDEVVVHRADGSAVSFTVARSVEVDKTDFPTEDVYGPTAGAELRLITCDGVFDRATGHYRDNLVVFATATTA